MRHFQKIADIDPVPLLNAVMRQPELWNQVNTRTWHPLSAHKQVDDILLRYNDFPPGSDYGETVCSELVCMNLPAFSKLPQAQSIVFGMMAKLNGEHLGRVFISRLAPGLGIPPHSDRVRQVEEAFPDKIPPAVYFSRYQIALKAQPGVVFRVLDEQVYMAPGEIWWFDNCVEHEVINNSADDRISMVVDIRSFHP